MKGIYFSQDLTHAGGIQKKINRQIEEFEKNGLVISGINDVNNLVEIIEIKDHPFFIACQFHPEFKSRPTRPHPLFDGFIKASIK